MLVALAVLDSNFQGLDAKLVNVVHDELVLEASEADAPAVQDAVESAMTEGMLAIFPQASITGLVEAHSSPNWAAAKGRPPARQTTATIYRLPVSFSPQGVADDQVPTGAHRTSPDGCCRRCLSVTR